MAAPPSLPLSAFESGDPAGIPLVLLHGFPLDHTMWTPQLEADLGARVIAPDLRGFGASYYGEPGTSLMDMADDVRRLLDGMEVDRFVVCGFSMGGDIALALAQLVPERVIGLIAVNSRPEAASAEERAKRDALIARVRSMGVQVLPERLIPEFFSARFLEEQPRYVASIRSIMEAQSVDGVVAALEAMRDRPDQRPILEAIRCPTLVIAGDEDEHTPLAHSEEFVRGIPGARLVVLEGTAHMSNLEDPDGFNAAVREFLASLKRSPATGKPTSVP